MSSSSILNSTNKPSKTRTIYIVIVFNWYFYSRLHYFQLVFVTTCLCTAVSLTLVREHRLIIIYLLLLSSVNQFCWAGKLVQCKHGTSITLTSNQTLTDGCKTYITIIPGMWPQIPPPLNPFSPSVLVYKVKVHSLSLSLSFLFAHPSLTNNTIFRTMKSQCRR